MNGRRVNGDKRLSRNQIVKTCLGWDSNPDALRASDFKSDAYTGSATPAEQ